MTPLTYYLEQCRNTLIESDDRQLEALDHLEHTFRALLAEKKQRESRLSILRKPKSIKGCYLQGGVGIGKTFLMDLFFQSLPFKEKKRLHFHEFMKMIHAQLTKHQGKKNPIRLIAHELAKKHIIICLDELFVSDIADAMILAGLLKALFDYGVCLVTTSNVIPNHLYERGLQRSQFLPAIALLNKHTHVIQMETKNDYRLRHSHHTQVFYFSNEATTDAKMEHHFSSLSNNEFISYDPLMINDRMINVVKRSHDVIWFDFKDLCNTPRCQLDYLVIAEKYKTILLSHVPVIPPESRNKISLFIHLIDVLYNAGTKLILSASERVDQLYPQGPKFFEYQRTCSRLLEMQSEHYFLREK